MHLVFDEELFAKLRKIEAPSRGRHAGERSAAGVCLESDSGKPRISATAGHADRGDAARLARLYSNRMEFEWDPEKDLENQANHGVSFDEASAVFGDPFAITIDDPDHSSDEDRMLTTGYSSRQRLIIVAHTDRDERIRIISARDVTAAERHDYAEEPR